MNESRDNPQNQPASTGSADDAAFEDLLRSAMQARPEPAAPPDLLLRAMALATADESVRVARGARRLARQRLWAQFASLAAAVLIVALLAGAARLMWSRGDIASIGSAASTSISTSTSASDGSSSESTSETTASDTDSSAAGASTSSTTSTIAVVFVAELLVLGIVLLSMSRRAPTMPWGAEALAGFW